VSIGCILATACVSLLVFRLNSKANHEVALKSDSPSTAENCERNLYRLKGYSMVQPLLFTDKACESPALANLKADVANYIDEQKAAGNIASASCYVRMLTTADWAAVNANEAYYPGSLFKLPLMLAILRAEEAHPGVLAEKITFKKGMLPEIPQTFESKTIVPGNTYTVGQLIEQMVIYSDNYATQLLNTKVAPASVVKVFSDMGLQPPPTDASYFNFTITARDYSRFLVTIYNATYLSPKLSEYAAELLCRSTFTDGMVKELPAGQKVAHKFGEAGHGAEKQLHESGLVYLGDTPYLITIMVRGAALDKLTPVITHVSRLVFDHVNKPAV